MSVIILYYIYRCAITVLHKKCGLYGTLFYFWIFVSLIAYKGGENR